MDGYAVQSAETATASKQPVLLAVVGQALPGQPFTGVVQTGQAVRIMTGAPVPEGADAVVPAELADESDGRVSVRQAVAAGRHIGRRGEDIAEGSTILQAGRRLRPQDVGVLASIGASPVAVIRRPTVAILATGDELLPCGSRPAVYHIVDSNSVMLAALVHRDGGVRDCQRLIPDQPEAIEAAFRDSASDVILVTGGSSVGTEDHAPRILAEIGELAVHGVALRPAGPAGIGFLDRRPVFLLPGNPVSCLCAYDLFAGPAVRRLGGRSMELPYRSEVMLLAELIRSAVGRCDYVRVRVQQGQVKPVTGGGASILSSTTRADGFILVPPEAAELQAGAAVRVYYYDV